MSLWSFEEEADVKCENAIKEAMKSDTQNPEAVQLMASFCLSKERKQVKFCHLFIDLSNIFS